MAAAAGASATANGCDAIDMPMANCANTRVEAIIDQDYSTLSGRGICPLSPRPMAMAPIAAGRASNQGLPHPRGQRDRGALLGPLSQCAAAAVRRHAGHHRHLRDHRDGKVIQLGSRTCATCKGRSGGLSPWRRCGLWQTTEPRAGDIRSDIANGMLSVETARRVYPQFAAAAGEA